MISLQTKSNITFVFRCSLFPLIILHSEVWEEKHRSRKRHPSASCEQSYMQHEVLINSKCKAKLEAFSVEFPCLVCVTSVTEMKKWSVSCTAFQGCVSNLVNVSYSVRLLRSNDSWSKRVYLIFSPKTVTPQTFGGNPRQFGTAVGLKRNLNLYN